MAHLIIKTITSLFFLLCFLPSEGQKYFTKTGRIEFFSKAPLEEIRAVNKTVSAIIDSKTGAVQYSVLMKGFEFEKALMQEHFNENYIESHKFPNAVFKGRITDNGAVNYAKDGTYPVVVTGNLTIRGITKPVTVKGSIRIENGTVYNNAVFNILLSDYDVKIPSVVKDNISNSVRITVSSKMDALK